MRHIKVLYLERTTVVLVQQTGLWRNSITGYIGVISRGSIDRYSVRNRGGSFRTTQAATSAEMDGIQSGDTDLIAL